MEDRKEETVGLQMIGFSILAMAFISGLIYVLVLMLPVRSYTECNMVVIDVVTISDVFGTENVYTIESNTGRYVEVCSDTLLVSGQVISGTIKTDRFSWKCNTNLTLK